MKSYLIYAAIFFIIFLLAGCGKNSNVPFNGSNKTWLVKDIAQHGGCAYGGPSSIVHFTFTYNDKSQIVRLDITNCSTPTHYEVVYDNQEKILKINYFFGSLPSPPNWIITYKGDFVHTAFTENNDTAHYPNFTYDWNLHNNKELDELDISKTQFSSSGSIFYTYILNALQSSSMDEGNQHQDLWASFAPNTTVPALPNPFQIDRTPEQKFLYYFLLYSVIGDLNLLGSGLPNGIYESYSYSTGSKMPVEHFYNNYTLDSNKNVAKIVPSLSLDAPAFNTYNQGNEIDITYEQH